MYCTYTAKFKKIVVSDIANSNRAAARMHVSMCITWHAQCMESKFSINSKPLKWLLQITMSNVAKLLQRQDTNASTMN